MELEVGAKAGAHAPVSACASGAEAIAIAYQMIMNGRADVVVVGGTEAATHPVTLASFDAMQALSRRNDDPAGASRPYDVTRDGFVMGEGSGILVLESEEHAKSRGARIYAYLAGVGLTSDAHHIAAPEPERRRPVARDAARASSLLARRRRTSRTSMRTQRRRLVGDMIEARGIRTLLGSHADQTLLSATKSMTGHLLGGAGAVESIFTIKAVHDRKAPPTINVTQPDPELQVDLVCDIPAGHAVGRRGRDQQLVRLRRPQRRVGLHQRVAPTPDLRIT